MSQRRVPKPVPQRIALVTGKRSVSIPHVVIVGGGFGGLYTAKRLKYWPVRVTLIDRRNHYLWRIDSLSLVVHSHYKREQHSFSLFPCECVPPAHRAGPPLVCRDTHPL